jgi:histone-lysine N-methyltransferase SETD3
MLRGGRHAGEPVIAWCGPQPNEKLLMNYGIVDENNPYDKILITATVPTSGPLFQAKRRMLDTAGALP